MITYLNRKINTDLDIEHDLKRHAQSGIQLLLLEDSNIEYGQRTEIQLFDDDPQKVILKRIPWGAYEVISSRAEKNAKTHHMTALTGIKTNDDSKVALYLQERNQPLSLCGETLIKGDCYLPKSGVKRAYVEGKNFVGDQLIHGKVRNIGAHFPQLTKQFRDDGHWNEVDANLESIRFDFDEIETDSVSNSFDSLTMVIQSNDELTLSEYYAGNVIITSEKAIHISSSAMLKNVLVAAPYIYVKDDFTGTAQFIASDSIIVGENCNFHYPSSFVIHSKNPASSEGIVFGSKSKLDGCLILYRNYYDRRNRSVLSIEKEAEITGQVYCNDAVNLKGSIRGSLVCSRFVLKTQSSIYENHLMDATIDKDGLSKEFVGNSFFSTSGIKEIIQWLN